MRRDGGRAFSLVELLVVIAILAILAALSAPLVSGLLRSRATTRAVSEISALLELARNEAMTRQGYAWIGFDAGTNAEGTDELRAVVLSTADGVVDTTTKGTTVAISTASAVTRTFRWENLKLVPTSELEGIKDLIREPSDPLAQQTRQSFRLGPAGSTITSFWTITFTPQGYALLKGLPDIVTPYAKFIDMGLQPTRGGKNAGSLDQAALVLDGINGHTEILRR